MKNEEIYYAMESVKYACLCSKYGKLREYMDSGNREPTEDYYNGPRYSDQGSPKEREHGMMETH